MLLAAQSVTRRAALQALGLVGVASAMPSSLLAAFPLQATIDADPLRPRFHLMPKRGWMNDPCAPVYYRGRYHMFFQYNPSASVWGDMHWAHAISTDMVHWSARPVALAPTPDGPDSFGVFTGSMVMDSGVPTVLYTCVSPSSQAAATLWGSNPPEREQQCLAKPVVTAPPSGTKITGFRDPVPWQEADGSYYMLLASGQKNVGGNVLLYKSKNLRQWNFQHIFAQGKWTGKDTDDTVDSGEIWECSDFFQLGTKHVLIHSTGTPAGRKTQWQTGILDRESMRWTPDQEGVLNHGPYYAPKTQVDADGNRILWGWIEETRSKDEFAKAGWAGCMSLPRVLTLQNGAVRFTPARQVDSLRGAATKDEQSTQHEVVLRVTRGTAQKTLLFDSPCLQVATSKSSGRLQWNGEEIAVFDLPDHFQIRCFMDHSVLEIFVGERIVLTQRVYDGKAARLELPSGYALQGKSSYALQSIT